MPVLDCPIAKEAWAHELSHKNGSLRLPTKTENDAGPWDAWIDKIEQFNRLDDDWDGLGASAPRSELIKSTVALAHLLSEKGVEPPQAVVAGVDGCILFEWQDGNGTYAEIEIVRPFFAEVMLLEPGKPAKHWTLPTE